LILAFPASTQEQVRLFSGLKLLQQKDRPCREGRQQEQTDEGREKQAYRNGKKRNSKGKHSQ